MRRALLTLVLALFGCIAAPNGDGRERALRQLSGAEESTGDVLKLAQRDAPELVPALEAIASALRDAQHAIERGDGIDSIEATILLVEGALVLATDQPRIGIALVAVKAALLQLKASL